MSRKIREKDTREAPQPTEPIERPLPPGSHTYHRTTMRSEKEIKKRLEWVEFLMNEYHRELQDARLWNVLVSLYWQLKWVLGEIGVQGSEPLEGLNSVDES